MTESAPETGDATPARPWKAVISCVTVIVVFAAAGLAQTAVGHRALSGLGLWASSEPFTALSFTDPLSVGRTSLYGPGRVPVAFTIANRRHRATTYQWQIKVGSSVRVTGTVTIPAGRSAELSHLVRIDCRRPRRGRRIPSSRQKVIVRLVGHVQGIDFWEQCLG